jgi:hypothetical protein
MLPLRRIIIERSIRPEILDFLSTDEVLELFSIYFDFINLQVPVLDRAFHTPGLVASRSPFLLTTGACPRSTFSPLAGLDEAESLLLPTVYPLQSAGSPPNSTANGPSSSVVSTPASASSRLRRRATALRASRSSRPTSS